MAAARGLGRRFRALFIASTITNLGDGVAAVAYPWLASAVTRNPLLIALVPVVQRLPWLVFTLPAGVLTDRLDRKRVIVSMDAARAMITAAVTVAVIIGGSSLPKPSELSKVDGGTNVAVYIVLLIATLLLGSAEVLRDNSAQTFLPSIVAADHLEKGNARLMTSEQIANSFVGPPLGGALLGLAYFVPFLVDAVSFALAAGLVATISGTFTPVTTNDPSQPRASFRSDLREGLTWLWRHPLLRPLAIVLGLMNAISSLAFAVYVLYAQEILNVSPTVFAILATGAAVGGLVGGLLAGRVRSWIGSGPSLWLGLGCGAVTFTVTGLTSRWPVVWLMEFLFMSCAVVWNVITVSLRQAIIPDHLLGRVNSVYRFFAWGTIPIGALLGGLIVTVSTKLWSRETALRMPFLVAGAASVVLFAATAHLFTSARVDRFRPETAS